MLNLLRDGVKTDVGVGTNLFSGGHGEYGDARTCEDVGGSVGGLGRDEGGMAVDDNSAVNAETPKFPRDVAFEAGK